MFNQRFSNHSNRSNNASKTVLVTGGCGYLGSQLIRDLATDPAFLGSTIRIIDNMQGKGYQALMNLPSNASYQFVEGDILDQSTLRYALRDVDVVIHLAAIVGTPMSFENPLWTEQVNHWGTAQLVEACIDANVKQFIFASSTAVYGPGGLFNEESVCRPIGAYANSKLRAEKAVQGGWQRGLKGTIVRLGSLFGFAPVVRFDAVVNRFAYLVGTDRPITIYGDGRQLRPFIHVADGSSALRFCITHPSVTNSRILNAVSENVAVVDIAELIQEIDPEVRLRYTDQDVLTHVSFSADSTLLNNAGWSPTISISLGLSQMLGHFSGIANAQ